MSSREREEPLSFFVFLSCCCPLKSPPSSFLLSSFYSIPVFGICSCVIILVSSLLPHCGDFTRPEACSCLPPPKKSHLRCLFATFLVSAMMTPIRVFLSLFPHSDRSFFFFHRRCCWLLVLFWIPSPHVSCLKKKNQKQIKLQIIKTKNTKEKKKAK